MAIESVSSSPSANNISGDHISPGGFDYNRIQGVRGNPHVSEAFIREVEAMAQRLGTQPEYVLAVMSFETGGSFRPDVRNAAGSGATGLIQFMPGTARELGTSTEALARMSAVDQLQYVERYFNNRSDPGDLNTLEGVYTTVLHGSPKPDPNSTLFSQGTAAYRMNAPLDTNRDGRITAGEATSFVRDRIDGDAPPPSDTTPTQPEPNPDTGSNPAPAGSYTVRSGDTLSAIAQRNGVSLSSLLAANPQISNPNLIYPGQQIHLSGNGSGGGSHTVRSGDTLSAIAASNGVSLSSLIAANPQIRDPDLIHPGQQVRIPGGGSTPPAPPSDGNPPTSPPPSDNVPTYAPYTVYSTGERPAFAVTDPDQLQAHHDYGSKVRDGQTLEVRDIVLHRNGQSQTQQAIPAPIAGTVVSAGPLGTAGNAVLLRGDQGQLVYVFHMSSIDVKAGQRVAYGQDLGNQGSTGNSTGPHVHIEAAPATIDRWVNDLLDGRFDGRRN